MKKLLWTLLLAGFVFGCGKSEFGAALKANSDERIAKAAAEVQVFLNEYVEHLTSTLPSPDAKSEEKKY